jgi:hypothetical protein
MKTQKQQLVTVQVRQGRNVEGSVVQKGHLSPPLPGLELGVETEKLCRWNLELVLCVMKSVFSKFPFV